MMKPAQKVVLVTGASSGIGKATAHQLVSEGHRVYGTSRSPAQPFVDGISFLPLDVRDARSIHTLVETLIAKEGRIDTIVNNAGFATISPAEEMTVEDAKQQFETNFFGAVAVINAILPTMRNQRAGQIINVTSLGGLMGIPFQAHYAATKHALEGYSESLGWELRPFNIRVHVIEPGFINTAIGENHVAGSLRFGDYNSMREAPIQHIVSSVSAGTSPKRVAVAVARLVSGHSTRFRTRVGPDAKWIPILKRLIPHSIFSMVIAKKFGVPASVPVTDSNRASS